MFLGSLSNDDDDVKNDSIIYKRKSRMSGSVGYANGSKNVFKLKNAATAFNSKRKYEKLAVVLRVPKTT